MAQVSPTGKRRWFLGASVAAVTAGLIPQQRAIAAILPGQGAPDVVGRVAAELVSTPSLIRLGARVRRSLPLAMRMGIEARISQDLMAGPVDLAALVAADLRAGRTCSVDGMMLSETESAVLARC